MGLVSGTVFMLCMFAFIPFVFTKHMSAGGKGAPRWRPVPRRHRCLSPKSGRRALLS